VVSFEPDHVLHPRSGTGGKLSLTDLKRGMRQGPGSAPLDTDLVRFLSLSDAVPPTGGGSDRGK